MNRKELVLEISLRLKKMRRYLGLSASNITYRLGLVKSSYYRNEAGKTAPDLKSFYLLGINFGISLDWLICNRGQMMYKNQDEPDTNVIPRGNMQAEVIELLEHMQKIPSLHYEILSRFHHFKEEHAEKVAREMKK